MIYEIKFDTQVTNVYINSWIIYTSVNIGEDIDHTSWKEISSTEIQKSIDGLTLIKEFMDRFNYEHPDINCIFNASKSCILINKSYEK
jgi:hypothetical protein